MLNLNNPLRTLISLSAFCFLLMAATVTQAQSPMRQVVAETSVGKTVWQVELASDDQSRQTGLMHRKSMPKLSGMLFRFEQTGPVAMWMKNTFIPLDMIFTDRAGKVTHVHAGAVPQSLDIISSNGPASFVLEINAGEAKARGIAVGTQLLHPWFSPS